MFKGFENIRHAQQIAAEAYERIAQELRPDMTERDIKKRVEMHLIDLGSFSFWRYGVGATVFLGERSTLSQSTKKYDADSRVPMGENNVVWMDLAPSDHFYWGDFTRTIVMEQGKVVRSVEKITDPIYRRGMEVQQEIHGAIRSIARPEMTFEELHAAMDAQVRSRGYHNLDFNQNYGHSVELRDEDRRFLIKGCKEKLSACDCFTFEPHIAKENSAVGMKWENIYYFDENGQLKEIRE